MENKSQCRRASVADNLMQGGSRQPREPALKAAQSQNIKISNIRSWHDRARNASGWTGLISNAYRYAFPSLDLFGGVVPDLGYPTIAVFVIGLLQNSMSLRLSTTSIEASLTAFFSIAASQVTDPLEFVE